MEFTLKNKIVWKKIGIIAGVYLGMKYIVPLMIPFFIAALVVGGCWPFLKWVKRRFHIKPPFVMAFLMVAFLVLFLGGMYVVGRKLGGGFLRLCSGTGYKGQMEALLYDCCESIGNLMHMEAEGIQIFVTEQLNLFMDHARQNILPGAMGGSWQFVKGTGAWITAVLVTGIAVLLLSADFEKVREWGKKSSAYGKAVSVFQEVLHSVGGYLKAQLTIMGIVMGICTVGIWISGSAGSPILAGVGTGFLDALPVFGTGTVFIPWVLIRILQREYASAAILGVTYALCMVTREFLEPKLIGGRLGLLPIVVLMSVYVGVKLYGFGGIVLGPLSVLLIKELWSRTPSM